MQKSIATFWPSFPPQRLRRPVIFWNHLPFKTYFTAIQSGKTIALKARLPCPWPVSKLPGPSVSPPSLCSDSSLSNALQTDVECRSDVRKIAKFGIQLAISQHLRSRMGAFGLKKHLTRTDLGKMIIDPRPSFQTVWLNQKCWYLKNVQKDVECRRDAKGWLTRMVAFGLKKHLTRTDLGKMIIDPRPSFQPAWLNQSVGI